MGLFISGLVLALAYFIFKLVRMYEPTQAHKYQNTRNYLTFFGKFFIFDQNSGVIFEIAVCSISMLTLTLVNSVICIKNFGNGLRQHCKDSRMLLLKDLTFFFLVSTQGQRQTDVVSEAARGENRSPLE